MKAYIKQTTVDYDEIKWEGGAPTFREKSTGRWFIPANDLFTAPLLVASHAGVPLLMDKGEVYLPFDWLRGQFLEKNAMWEELETRLATVP